MTVIQPNKDSGILKLIMVLSSLLVGVASLTIIIYSKTVSVSQDIANLTQSVQNAQVKNAELKDQFYKITDPNNLKNLAAADGLVREVNPQWAFVSRS